MIAGYDTTISGVFVMACFLLFFAYLYIDRVFFAWDTIGMLGRGLFTIVNDYLLYLNE